MTTTPEPLDTYAVVEAMGHRTAIGRVSEATIAGKQLLRVDRLDGAVQYYPPESLYCLTPCTREQAEAAQKRSFGNGGLPYGLAALTSGSTWGDVAEEDRCCCGASGTVHEHETDEDGVCRHCGCERPPARDDEGDPF
jgi:hypothetical protein